MQGDEILDESDVKTIRLYHEQVSNILKGVRVRASEMDTPANQALRKMMRSASKLQTHLDAYVSSVKYTSPTK